MMTFPIYGTKKKSVPNHQPVAFLHSTVLVGTNTASLTDLQRHCAAHHVARRQVLCRGRVARHEGIALTVALAPGTAEGIA